MAVNPESPSFDDAPLVAAARAAHGHAYAPYSRFKVGAALRLVDGRIVTGGNVENASYGLTICAERSAVVAAVAQGMGVGDIAAVVVVTDAAELTPPCGACRQVLAEFAPPETPVALHAARGDATQLHTVGTLLPHAFTPSMLRQRV
ncbi:MAG TPA: cytidine deaminase [Myxococcota bacterium]|nr:cytidine deaminase [Myxococcota bacterium]